MKKNQMQRTREGKRKGEKIKDNECHTVNMKHNTNEFEL